MEQAMFPQNENNTPFDNEALFDAEGHLTDEGLHALQESRLDELGSLETAEHLTFCDYCLARYTALIESAPEKLKQPMRDLIPQVQALMRLRSFRIMTNRYVSAAAAVVLGFVMWGAVSTFGVPNAAALLPQQPAARPERFGTKFNTAVNGFRRNAGLCAVAVRVLWRRWYGAKARAAAAGRYPQSNGKPGAWRYV